MKVKTRLIASAPSAEKLLEMIAQYFCGSTKDYEIYEVVSNGKYSGTVIKKRTGEKMSRFVVNRKKDRYRFEAVVN